MLVKQELDLLKESKDEVQTTQTIKKISYLGIISTECWFGHYKFQRLVSDSRIEQHYSKIAEEDEQASIETGTMKLDKNMILLLQSYYNVAQFFQLLFNQHSVLIIPK